MAAILLHDYWRSSASYRVRIALNLKGVAYERVAVDLLAGAQRSDAYRAENPQGFVPMLDVDGRRLTQSLAIIDYLDATRPEPRLIPADPAAAAHVRALALAIACDIHPINNLRVLKHLAALGHDQAARDEWYRHWLREGLEPLEAMAKPHAGAFLFSDAPTLADVCLVPQLYNARRFGVSLDNWLTLVHADASAAALPAFAAAHPDRVAPDAAAS